MKPLPKILFAILLMVYGIVAQAENVTGEVKRIYPDRNTIHFRLKSDTCLTGSQYYYFRMNQTDDEGMYAAKNWYSMLLASAIAGKPVSVKVPSCPSEGHVEIEYMYQEY